MLENKNSYEDVSEHHNKEDPRGHHPSSDYLDWWDSLYMLLCIYNNIQQHGTIIGRDIILL